MPERENNRLVKRIDAYGGDILRSSRFRSTRKNIQHGTVSVYEHSISVAGCSLKIMDGLKSLGDPRERARAGKRSPPSRLFSV